MKQIAYNKKWLFEYEIGDKYSCGVVLHGHEVKSLRAESISLHESIIKVYKGELWVTNMHIPLYKKTSVAHLWEYDTKRMRKLLVHKKELAKIAAKLDQWWWLRAIIIELLRHSNGRVKVVMGIWKKKKQAQKKQLIKERDIERQAQRDIRDY